MTPPTPIRGIKDIIKSKLDEYEYQEDFSHLECAIDDTETVSKELVQLIDDYYKKYYGEKVRGAMPKAVDKQDAHNCPGVLCLVCREVESCNQILSTIHTALDKLFGIEGKK